MGHETAVYLKHTFTESVIEGFAGTTVTLEKPPANRPQVNKVVRIKVRSVFFKLLY